MEVLQYNLERAGLATDVYERGDVALEGLRSRPPDVILLDLMLPGLDGLELARTLKRNEQTARIPIIVVTAKSEEVDRIVGLELGADDYITKPFSPREVVLRVKAVLRRARAIETPPEEVARKASGWSWEGLRLDPEGYRLFVAGEEVAAHSDRVPTAPVPARAQGPRLQPRPTADRHLGLRRRSRQPDRRHSHPPTAQEARDRGRPHRDRRRHRLSAAPMTAVSDAADDG